MDTRLVRCIAALLIANSHLGDYYPIPQLAGDGLLGNSLFFLLSGFGLSVGDSKVRRPPLQWFSRRISKLYPSLLLILAFLAVYDFPKLNVEHLSDVFRQIVWPESYPFVRQITTYYVIYFIWSRTLAGAYPLIWALGLIPIYSIARAVYPIETRTHVMHDIYYFQMFMLGVALSKSPVTKSLKARKISTILLPITLVIYLGTKFILSRSGQAVTQVQLLHLLAVPNLVAMVLTLAAPGLISKIDSVRPLGRFTVWLAGSTFEVYLVHYLVLENQLVQRLPLPLNLAVFWCGTFLGTFVLRKARDLAVKVIQIDFDRFRTSPHSHGISGSAVLNTPELTDAGQPT